MQPSALTNNSRVRKHSSKRQTVKVTIWVKPAIKAEVQRLAETEGLSVSKCAGTLLEEAIHQKLHIQHAILLQPIIEQAISHRMAAISTRLSSLLVRGVLDIGQVRRLVVNLLARQPGMTQQTLEEILDGSQEGSRKQITHLTPQLTSLIQEVEKWLLQDGEAGTN